MVKKRFDVVRTQYRYNGFVVEFDNPQIGIRIVIFGPDCF
jgi:hypothetical protein